MIKYFNLEDSENPGIVKVKVLKTNEGISSVEVIEIIKKSSFRPCKVGKKLKVSNLLLRDEL